MVPSEEVEETSEYGILGRHQSCSEERIEVPTKTRSNAIILHETLPAYCIPKVVRMETGEIIYEKVYASPRPPPNISLKHDWMKELGSEVAQRPDGQVVQQFKSSQLNLQYCCNQVWMKVGGQIPWNAFAICETFKISYLMGRPHMRDVVGNH